MQMRWVKVQLGVFARHNFVLQEFLLSLYGRASVGREEELCYLERLVISSG